MSTVIKMIPKEHATKRTTAVIITNDGIIRTRVEDPVGTATDKQFNFSSYAEGTFREINNEPVVSVSSEKIGTNSRFIITVNEFYDPTLVGENAPQERFLWYDYKTKANEAPSSTAAQTFPINTFWTSGGSPAVPTIAFPGSYTDETIAPLNLYTSLANVDNRRNYLKGRILRNINHPTLPMWIAGGGISAKDDTDVSELLVHVQRLQAIPYWLEMLTGAISVDANLATEQKFNLLEGESGLSVLEVLQKTGTTFAHNIDGSGNRDTFTFRSLGSVASSSPWKYTAPSGGTWADRDASSTISMSGSQAGAGIDWVSWLRSL